MDQTDVGHQTFIGNAACAACLARPCEHLRCGGGCRGSFLFLHSRRLGPGFEGACPYAAGSFDEVELLLALAPAYTINDQMNDVLADLSVAECLAFDHRHYISGFADTAGAIAYLRMLYDAGILRVARIPIAGLDNAVPSAR